MYCSNCGKKIADDAKFCDGCGARIENITDETNKFSDKDGTVFKCPHCGEYLAFDAIVCPSCGHELRGKKAAESVKEFSRTITATTDLKSRELLIRTFPIPSSREDILEFMVLASSNFYSTGSSRNSIELGAWAAKMDQCYKKGKTLLKDESDIERLNTLFFGKNKEEREKIKVEARKNKKKAIISFLLSFPSLIISLVFYILFVSVSTYKITINPETEEEIKELIITPAVALYTSLGGVFSLLFIVTLTAGIVFFVNYNNGRKVENPETIFEIVDKVKKDELWEEQMEIKRKERLEERIRKERLEAEYRRNNYK